MAGRSLHYLDGADRLSQGAFYFPSFGLNKRTYAGNRGKRRGQVGGKSPRPGGGGLRELGQGQQGQ